MVSLIRTKNVIMDVGRDVADVALKIRVIVVHLKSGDLLSLFCQFAEMGSNKLGNSVIIRMSLTAQITAGNRCWI